MENTILHDDLLVKQWHLVEFNNQHWDNRYIWAGKRKRLERPQLFVLPKAGIMVNISGESSRGPTFQISELPFGYD